MLIKRCPEKILAGFRALTGLYQPIQLQALRSYIYASQLAQTCLFGLQYRNIRFSRIASRANDMIFAPARAHYRQQVEVAALSQRRAMNLPLAKTDGALALQTFHAGLLLAPRIWPWRTLQQLRSHLFKRGGHT